MRMSWKLGRIAGIDVYLHPTLLLFFLPGVASGISPLLIAALFGCVLLHEFGHALMARRFGIGTLDITLYPIGGVARLQRLPRAPGAELLVALAGPAVNFAIVLALIAFNLLLPTAGGYGSGLGEFADGLILTNLLLGVFNLVPAFPMDGGRVLRALLSGWLGRARATSVAAGLGRTLALAFGIYSLWWAQYFQTALAIFIYFAANAEVASVWAEERRRSDEQPQSQGIWTAPAGYCWVQRGTGVWQLAPIVSVSGGHAGRAPWHV